MKIKYFNNYRELSQYGANLLTGSLKEKKVPVFCAASGNSPTLLYKYFVEEALKDQKFTKRLKIIGLDEWAGISSLDHNSCRSYLKKHLIRPLKISDKKFIAFKSEAQDLHRECKRVQKKIDSLAPINTTILGLGKNGHIGFNEPSEQLYPHCHVVKLSKASLQHAMSQSMGRTPLHGITLGMKDILSSKKIILIITGKGKKKIIREFLKRKITTHIPATFLWLHKNALCLIDRESLKE